MMGHRQSGPKDWTCSNLPLIVPVVYVFWMISGWWGVDDGVIRE
jgi:hypothetical protein